MQIEAMLCTTPELFPDVAGASLADARIVRSNAHAGVGKRRTYQSEIGTSDAVYSRRAGRLRDVLAGNSG